MGKMEKAIEASRPKPEDRVDLRVAWEVRHAILRLELARNELCWVFDLLLAGHINPDAVIQVLDETMDNLAGPGVAE